MLGEGLREANRNEKMNIVRQVVQTFNSQKTNTEDFKEENELIQKITFKRSLLKSMVFKRSLWQV